MEGLGTPCIFQIEDAEQSYEGEIEPDTVHAVQSYIAEVRELLDGLGRSAGTGR